MFKRGWNACSNMITILGSISIEDLSTLYNVSLHISPSTMLGGVTKMYPQDPQVLFQY